MDDVRQLFRDHKDCVFRLALSFTGSSADAEDVTQTVFLKLIEKNPVLEKGRERAWLLQVTANECRTLYRRLRVRSTVSLDEALAVAAPEEDRLLLERVMELKSTDRAAEDLKSNKVIAESHRELWGQAMVDSLMESGDVGPETFVEEYPSASEIGENAALVLLRMKDGRVVTRSQLEYSLRSMRWLDEEGRQRRVVYQTDWPLDLEQVSAVILGDLEFPLDGSEPFHVEVDPYLLPVEAELYRYPVGDGQGRNYIADVEALCKALGARYTWNGASGTAVAEYRDVTVSLTADSSTALVDGNPVEMETRITDGEMVPLPAVEREGKLSAIVTVFTDAWGIGVEARMREVDGIPTEYVDFLVIP